MMITGNESANRDLGAGGLARGGKRGGAYPFRLYDTPKSAKRQAPIPPPHLTEQESTLWQEAEQVRDTDPIEYRERRRRLLLAQAARWEANR